MCCTFIQMYCTFLHICTVYSYTLYCTFLHTVLYIPTHCTVYSYTYVLYIPTHMYCIFLHICTVYSYTYVLYIPTHMYCIFLHICTVYSYTYVLYCIYWSNGCPSNSTCNTTLTRLDYSDSRSTGMWEKRMGAGFELEV